MGLGTVDLPVQRERHTGWPTIPGSAPKGILRDRCRTWRARLAIAARHGLMRTTAPQLRGVWGMALHGRDPCVYRDVFEGGGKGAPRYLLRPT